MLELHKAVNGIIAIFTGSDALTCSNLEFGGAGAVVGISNVMPKESSKIFDEFKSGNLKKAQEAQEKLLPLIQAIGLCNYPAGLKEAMKLVGMPVGDVKPPLLPLSKEEKLQVKNLLKQIRPLRS